MTNATDSGGARRKAAVDHAAHAAFTAMYDEHVDGVLRMLRMMVPDHIAQEIAGDLFVGVWSDDRFDPQRGTRRAYLHGIARHKALDWMRRHYTGAASDRRLAARRSDVDTPEEWACATDDARQVRKALERLDPARREAILLAYFGGLTYCQVAALLELPEGTVKTRIRTGLRELRAALGATAVPAGHRSGAAGG